MNLDAEKELRRRREQGKVSQRAFRERQSAAVRKLKEEHEELKILVAGIVDSARIDDRVQLNAAIVKAGSAAGLNVTGLAARQPLAPEDTIIGQEIAELYDTELPQDFSSQVVPVSVQHYSQIGRMSPRFDYGLWLDADRILKIFQPPIDIVPYVGTGAHTIAGKINWACLDYAIVLLQETSGKRITLSMSPGQVSDYPQSLPRNPEARDFFDRSLRHSEPLHDIAYLAALVEARMDFRALGYMRGDHLGANEELRESRYQGLLGEFLKNGIRMNEWWSPLQIERYIEEKMGVFEFVAFQAAVNCEGVEGVEMGILRPMIQTLARTGVCFGDGARWKADYAMEIVDTYLFSVSRVTNVPQQ
ncbi:hypothetical protein B7494_g3362 [Chlorociboria aeruginascens]|nr:hypothetical protein B7494_g3362 [Chlorociboria aeruginascens]